MCKKGENIWFIRCSKAKSSFPFLPKHGHPHWLTAQLWSLCLYPLPACWAFRIVAVLLNLEYTETHGDDPIEALHRSLHLWGEGSWNPREGMQRAVEPPFPPCTRGMRWSLAGLSKKGHVWGPEAGRTWPPVRLSKWAVLPHMNWGTLHPQYTQKAKEAKQFWWPHSCSCQTYTLGWANKPLITNTTPDTITTKPFTFSP